MQAVLTVALAGILQQGATATTTSAVQSLLEDLSSVYSSLSAVLLSQMVAGLLSASAPGELSPAESANVSAWQASALPKSLPGQCLRHQHCVTASRQSVAGQAIVLRHITPPV